MFVLCCFGTMLCCVPRVCQASPQSLLCTVIRSSPSRFVADTYLFSQVSLYQHKSAHEKLFLPLNTKESLWWTYVNPQCLCIGISTPDAEHGIKSVTVYSVSPGNTHIPRDLGQYFIFTSDFSVVLLPWGIQECWKCQWTLYWLHVESAICVRYQRFNLYIQIFSKRICKLSRKDWSNLVKLELQSL